VSLVGPSGEPLNIQTGPSREFREAVNSLNERLRWARQVGISFNGARDFYTVFGYDRAVTTTQYREAYQRGGLSGRLVDLYPNATWRGETPFEVIENEDPREAAETKFEAAWKLLSKRLQIPSKFLRVDKLSCLSTFAVLLIGTVDGALETELPRLVTPNQNAIIYLTPFQGGGTGGMTRAAQAMISADADASIESYVEDTSNPRFGLPLTYKIKRTDFHAPGLEKPVHWTRVIHVAEGLLDDDVNGLPKLERVWNLLQDLEKVTGGGSEAFWLRANQGLHLDIDKDMALSDVDNTVANLKEQAEDYKHQLTRWLRTRGVNVDTLSSDVADFMNPADAILTQIAGAMGVPKRILTGAEMGELASSQDRENWRDQIVGRQTNHAGPFIVRQFVDRLIQYGYLPQPAKGADEYQVTWPHIQVLTEAEKSAGAKDWASTNATQQQAVFTDDEIRDHWYGMPPLSEEQLQKIKDQEAEKQQQAADAQAAALAKMQAQQPDAQPKPDNVVPFNRAAEALALLVAEALDAGDRKEALRLLGDVEGHDFHGNQWTSGQGSIEGSTEIPTHDSSHYTPLNASGHDTKSKFSDGHGHYTPERQALHQAIVNHYLQGTTPVNNPQAIVFGGGTASGKSTVAKAEKLGEDNTVHVDADQIKTHLPEYKEGLVRGDANAAAISHEESSDISKMLMQRALSDKRNVLLDGTGNSSITSLEKKVVAMRNAGHEVVGRYVTVPTEVALTRAMERGNKTGRYVPETVIRGIHSSVSNIFPLAVEKGFFDRAELHDTSTAGKATKVMSSVGKKITVHNEKLWNSFLAKSAFDDFVSGHGSSINTKEIMKHIAPPRYTDQD
jgi:predicted ABC-type ATPase